MPGKKRLDEDIAVETGEAPARPEPEGRQVTLEETTELAERLKLLRVFIFSIDREVLAVCIRDMRKRASTDDAIGCLLQPDGYAERSDVAGAQIEYLEKLLELRDLEGNLEGAIQKRDKNKGELAKALKALGLGGV